MRWRAWRILMLSKLSGQRSRRMAAEAVGTVRGTVRCRCVLLSVLALLLTAVDGLGYREVAEILGCSLGTVATRRCAALQKLRRRLAP